jgi:4-amino-4-deoxy-L-arabinose transferase-like glycosyltransferase
MRAFLGLACLALVALFVGLERPDWMDEREARDAAVAQRLVAFREPLTPTLDGTPWFEKPVLGYALEAAAITWSHGTPAGPRAARAVLAIALVALTVAIGRRWLGGRAGWLAGAVLATSLALPLAARTDGTQLFATSLGWIGWAVLARARSEGDPPRHLTLGYLALALALLIAGPFPALWPLIAVAWGGGPAPGGRLHRRAGLILMLGLALPWYGAMLERHGAAFVAALPAFPYGEGPGAPWYTLPARVLGFLVVGFFPWSTMLPVAALYRWTNAGTAPSRVSAASRQFLVALGVALAPIGFATAAPLPAILPALPAAALLVGGLLDRAFSGEPLAGRAVAQAAWLTAGAGTVAAVLMELASRRLGPGASELRLLAAFLLVSAWGPALASFMGRNRALPALFAVLVALGTPLVLGRTLPALEGYLSAGPVAAAMNGVSAHDAPLLLLESPPASLRIVLERNLAVPPRLAPAFHTLRGADGWAYVAYAPRRESEVARAASPAPLDILLRTPAWVLARVRP